MRVQQQSTGTMAQVTTDQGQNQNYQNQQDQEKQTPFVQNNIISGSNDAQVQENVRRERERLDSFFAESTRNTESLIDAMKKSFDKKDADEEVKPAQSLNDKFGKTAQIGLNDKLAFVQKLFFGSESEYNKVVKHIADLHSMQDAVVYIEQEVKPTYNYWKGKEEYEQRFLDLVLKRFEV